MQIAQFIRITMVISSITRVTRKLNARTFYYLDSPSRYKKRNMLSYFAPCHGSLFIYIHECASGEGFAIANRMSQIVINDLNQRVWKFDIVKMLNSLVGLNVPRGRGLRSQIANRNLRFTICS